MAGLGFLLGGIEWSQQHYNAFVSYITGTLLLLAVTSLIIPRIAVQLTSTTPAGILHQSRGTAAILFAIYIFCLFFQLKTHASNYNEPSPKTQKRARMKEVHLAAKSVFQTENHACGQEKEPKSLGQPLQEHNGKKGGEQEEETKRPQHSTWIVLVVMILTTILLAFNLKFATDSLEELMQTAGLSKTLVGMILLPLLGNDATPNWSCSQR
jgi:Ca2+:H+ antiporter